MSNPAHCSRPDVSIVVPTFCEAQNLPTLIEQTFAATARAALRAEMIIVDDNSPDETPRLIDRLARYLPVRLIVRRQPRDLARSVLCGFHHARADLLLVMDADLSHPPQAVPPLLAAVLQRHADIAIGSRYVPGAQTVGWPLSRRLASRLAALSARPLAPVRDPLAGFFCLPKTTWLRAGHFHPAGYKIGLELMVRANCRRIVELPIIFRQRRLGASKLGPRQYVCYFRQLCRLYLLRARAGPSAKIG